MESSRAREIQPFIAMDILEKAYALERAGRDIVHLEIGEPDLDMPAAAREAAERAIRNGWTHYTHSLGIWELREAIAERYSSRYGVEVSPERVIVTAGASGAFLLLFGVLFDPGNRVLLSDPGYPCYANFARFVGAEPLAVPVDADHGFSLTPDRLDPELEKGDIRGVVVSSPANPTGTVTPRETYEWLAGRAPALISDEIYHGLRYNGGREFTALEIDDDSLVIDGLSKRYAMTGMRVGWMVVPERLVRAVNKISQNLFISVGSVSQHAAVAAIREGEPDVERMVGIYRERHHYLVGALREIGFRVEVVPQGAFYVFARMSHLHPDSYEFCLKMLEEAGVAATPGVDFGNHRTREYVRFAYTNSMERIREGMQRLGDWLQAS